MKRAPYGSRILESTKAASDNKTKFVSMFPCIKCGSVERYVTKGGLDSTCVLCIKTVTSAALKSWRQNNKERVNNNQRAYRKKLKENNKCVN